MEARNQLQRKEPPQLKQEDNFAISNMKYAQGLGAAIRYSSELHAVRQASRLPLLPSSNLHEDVLRGNLGAGTGFEKMFGEPEDVVRLS